MRKCFTLMHCAILFGTLRGNGAFGLTEAAR